MDGFHPHVVHRQHESGPRPPEVEYRDREHSVEMRGELGAVLHVEGRQEAAVAEIVEAVPTGGQPSPQLAVVVDLPVQHGEHTGGGTQPVRLAAVPGIRDGEPVAPQRPAAAAEHSTLVGSAVTLPTRHSVQLGGGHPSGE